MITFIIIVIIHIVLLSYLYNYTDLQIIMQELDSKTFLNKNIGRSNLIFLIASLIVISFFNAMYSLVIIEPAEYSL